ncbi:dnaK suppressor protein [Salmonella enterica subsp. enterica]|nr:dnaK suppressor protein [Salmonella enterica subsp. enterica]
MQEGQNRKTSSLSILAIAGVEPYQEKPGEEYMNEAPAIALQAYS